MADTACEVVTWHPRVGVNGDELYQWPDYYPITAGPVFDDGFVIPDPVTVNTLYGFNQIIYEVNRRMLWDMFGAENSLWFAPADMRRYNAGVFGKTGSFHPVREAEFSLSPVDRRMQYAVDSVTGSAFSLATINALKLAIFYIEDYEGRPHYPFTFPVVGGGPTFPDLSGTLAGSGILKQEIFELRKALATPYISIWPSKTDMFISTIQGNVGLIRGRNTIVCPSGGWPCFTYPTDIYMTLFACATLSSFGITNEASTFDGAIGQRIDVDHSVGGGASRLTYEVHRKPFDWNLPPQLPPLDHGFLLTQLRRTTALEIDRISTNINVMLATTDGVVKDTTCSLNIWDKPVVKIGSIPIDDIGALDAPLALVGIPITDVSYFVGGAKIPMFLEPDTVTDRSPYPLPPLPAVGLVTTKKEGWDGGSVFAGSGSRVSRLSELRLYPCTTSSSSSMSSSSNRHQG